MSSADCGASSSFRCIGVFRGIGWVTFLDEMEGQFQVVETGGPDLELVVAGSARQPPRSGCSSRI